MDANYEENCRRTHKFEYALNETWRSMTSVLLFVFNLIGRWNHKSFSRRNRSRGAASRFSPWSTDRSLVLWLAFVLVLVCHTFVKDVGSAPLLSPPPRSKVFLECFVLQQYSVVKCNLLLILSLQCVCRNLLVYLGGRLMISCRIVTFHHRVIKYVYIHIFPLLKLKNKTRKRQDVYHVYGVVSQACRNTWNGFSYTGVICTKWHEIREIVNLIPCFTMGLQTYPRDVRNHLW